jgi:hypothetical protein
MSRTRVKKALFALFVFLAIIQIFQPRRTNPIVVPSSSLAAHVDIAGKVYSALIRSRGDCHTSQTHWPWYGHVRPLSWVIADDVNEV